jgi:hypothetical protein
MTPFADLCEYGQMNWVDLVRDYCPQVEPERRLKAAAGLYEINYGVLPMEVPDELVTTDDRIDYASLLADLYQLRLLREKALFVALKRVIFDELLHRSAEHSAQVGGAVWVCTTAIVHLAYTDTFQPFGRRCLGNLHAISYRRVFCKQSDQY